MVNLSNLNPGFVLCRFEKLYGPRLTVWFKFELFSSDCFWLFVSKRVGHVFCYLVISRRSKKAKFGLIRLIPTFGTFTSHQSCLGNCLHTISPTFNPLPALALTWLHSISYLQRWPIAQLADVTKEHFFKLLRTQNNRACNLSTNLNKKGKGYWSNYGSHNANLVVLQKFYLLLVMNLFMRKVFFTESYGNLKKRSDQF